MGFKAYQIESREAGVFALGASRALTFSGPDGLVAIWTAANRGQAERPWQVPPSEWLHVSGLGLAPENHWIVFEQRDDSGKLRFARLVSVSGVCSLGRTDLLFALEPMLNLESPDATLVKREARPRLWSEELVLEGSPGVPKCSWRWGHPKLAIGSATVGGRA